MPCKGLFSYRGMDNKSKDILLFITISCYKLPPPPPHKRILMSQYLSKKGERERWLRSWMIAFIPVKYTVITVLISWIALLWTVRFISRWERLSLSHVQPKFQVANNDDEWNNRDKSSIFLSSVLVLLFWWSVVLIVSCSAFS